MKKEIVIQDTVVAYELTHKAVKNINLRIRAEGTVHVSANRRVPQSVIDQFLHLKGELILKALEQCKQKREVVLTPFYDEKDIEHAVITCCQKVYPYFEKHGVAYPIIKFRKMVSCWGNCRKDRGVLTFNKNLRFAPPECIEYVVLHEFTHFLQPNHSSKFYEELSKVCPNWKERRQKLKEIQLR